MADVPMDTLLRIEKSLAHIESLLQRMPEIQAAVFLQMSEEKGIAAPWAKASELWEVCPPNQR